MMTTLHEAMAGFGSMLPVSPNIRQQHLFTASQAQFTKRPRSQPVSGHRRGNRGNYVDSSSVGTAPLRAASSKYFIAIRLVMLKLASFSSSTHRY